MQLEKTIENKFVDAVTEAGCIPLKLNISSRKAFPDRLILLPDNVHYFVEFKRPGEKPTKLQEHIHSILRGLGHVVCTFDNCQEAIEHFNKVRAEGLPEGSD